MESIGVSAIQGIFNLAASYAGKRLQILYDLDRHIDRLESKFLPPMNEYIRRVEDAELKKMLVVTETEQRSSKDGWLQTFKDLAMDIEDILDEVSIRKTRNISYQPVCGCFVPSCFDCSDSSRSDGWCKFYAEFRTRIAFRISDIYANLEDITNDKETLMRLFPENESPSDNTVGDGTYERRPPESSINRYRDFKMIGRVEDMDNILSKLLSTESRTLVIPIMGMGGVGKTTIARSVFNDTRVKSHFKFTKWVFVGIKFDAETLLKVEILDDPQFDGGLDRLYNKVIEKVKDTRFLIVLDDVWNKDQGQWDKLLTPLDQGGDGSRILITTREVSVAEQACKSSVYHVKLETLDNERCVELFEQYAFGNGVPDEHNSLRKMGREIVAKIQGHPLAAIVIGSSLCGETKESEWKKILYSSLWSDDVKDKHNTVMSTLLWSYCRLPHHLKQCFRLCSIFEKGERITRTALIEMWVAHGYVSGSTRLKDIGSRYIDDLCSASLFQNDFGYDCGLHYGYSHRRDDVYLGNDHGRIQMHDLIHDFAQLVSRGEASRIIQQKIYTSNPTRRECFLELSSAGNTIQIQQQAWGTLTDQAKNIRHLAVYAEEFYAFDWDILLKFIDWKRLRTLIVRGVRTIPKSVSSQLRSVRVLVVALLNIKDFDDMIINVVHLRVLSGVASDLRGHVSKLTKLRVLDPSRYSTEIKGIGKITSLQYLHRYCVQDKDGYKIKELKGLQLHGRLTITNLENVKGGMMEAQEAMLHEKEHLTDLELIWSYGHYLGDRSSIEEEVLKGLCPHQNLRRLGVEGFPGRHFGLALNNYASIVSIRLYMCQNLVELPPLGQMSGLKYLKISCLYKMRKVTRQFYGSSLGHAAAVVFPSLEELKISKLEEWTEWDGLEDKDNNNVKFFPSLQKLEIRDCKKLSGIPHLPSSIKTLKLASVGLTTIPIFWGCKGGIHDQQKPSLLSELYISRCSSLETIGECLLEHPASSVESIEIEYCDSLTEISASKHFSLVGSMEVRRCENLKTLNLPGAGNVTDLHIYSCDYLSEISLGNPILSCREGLGVTSVVSETVTDLTADSWQSSHAIHVVQLSGSDSSGVMEYPLHNVGWLYTDIWDVLNFVCPAKLIYLKLHGPYRRRIATNEAYSYEAEKQWWQSLTSLETLELIDVDDLLGRAWFWENLQRIPFLRTLEFGHCNEIKALQEKDLPRSLRELRLYDCLHLEERYQEGGLGRDILLAHIPQLKITLPGTWADGMSLNVHITRSTSIH